jgi:hypothetical protein
MEKSGKMAQKFLQQLTSEDSRGMFEGLADLVEVLENKNDPEQTEMYLVQNIYHFFEKLKALENNLQSYVRESAGELPGNKLDMLYDETKSTGSSILFED